MEAMTCGRPVVAMDTGDIPSLIEDGQTGFIVPQEDEARLVQCLATLLTDRELCCRMGMAGRAKAHAQHRAHKQGRQTTPPSAVAPRYAQTWILCTTAPTVTQAVVEYAGRRAIEETFRD